jgi:hypothetical protein
MSPANSESIPPIKKTYPKKKDGKKYDRKVKRIYKLALARDGDIQDFHR